MSHVIALICFGPPVPHPTSPCLLQQYLFTFVYPASLPRSRLTYRIPPYRIITPPHISPRPAESSSGILKPAGRECV